MKKAIIYFMIMIMILAAGCKNAPAPKDTYSRDIFALDTYINCQIVTDDQDLANAGLDAVEKAFLDIDRLSNRFESDSEVTRVNEQAGIKPVEISEDLLVILETALEWSEKTDGVFNILIGSVMDLWGFGTENPAVPEAEELADALSKTDYRKIILNKPASTIFLPEKGMVMDLGSVAKGYATDKAVAALKELGIENALINAGGNVYAMGKRNDGASWRVGVQDPRNPQGIKAVLEASDNALVSSGDYQRYFEVDGIRYHHIIDPATGYPAIASTGTTVIMKSAAIADILSTVFFVKGHEDSISMAQTLSSVEAVMIITGDGEVYGTQSLTNYLAEH